MARIAGVNIPTNKRVLIGLQYIHGIGSTKAREIVTKVGIPDERRVSQLTDQEVLRRLLFSSVNEACKILEEGKALRASDIDVMWLNGFGFPRYRGGLMFWADGIGAREVYNQIAAWHQRYGARWRPSRFP